MKRHLFLLTIGIALLLAACVRDAATQQVLSSSALIGLSVETRNGELVGSLRSLLLASADGHIEYGVVQLAPGPLEFGKTPLHPAPNRVLVPWRLLSVAPSGNHLVANCTLDRARNAPPAPDHLRTDQPGWDVEYSTYWCEGALCSGATINGQ